MHTLSARVHSRMHVAAGVLTAKLQEHAAKRGAPADLVPHLQVTWDGAAFSSKANDPAYQQAFEDHEWGTFEHPPIAFARTFEPEMHAAFTHALDHALRAHIAGER